ncbi:MAG TPA: APC family permease [Candidatus Dormibacteraeota bacterium]|nr:APC family permease [Candidatus Dormibacteraeota bacterium]
MSEGHVQVRRRIKVRGGNLGMFLCWAVVFADIGTSIYYTPGYLFASGFVTRSALFVTAVLFVFGLLCIKYAEVTWRYPEGGGVVNVSSQALHPFAGLLGGMFILVDYYLTAAISAVSGVIYFAIIVPSLRPVIVLVVISALIGLGVLNLLGIKESARTTAIFATLAAAGQLVVVVATAIHLGPHGIVDTFHAATRGPALTPLFLVQGYGAAFLAFSGLESIAQLAPAMREPRRVIANRAMGAVVLTMAITSPLLTLWSTTLLSGNTDPQQFISLLGTRVAGNLIGDYVAISGSILLVFASNTAIIGAYHVFIALARMGFLPRALERRNRVRFTPHWAILAATALPVVMVLVEGANVENLGDLYAFGLLGTFVLTCISLDVVRWREYRRMSLARMAFFGVGVLTTLLVVAAWSTNLYYKPDATKFGGGLTLVGLVVGLSTYRYYRSRQPSIFPVPFRPQRAAESIAAALGGKRLEGDVLVILPHEQLAAEAVITEAARAAHGRGAVFVYRGTRHGKQYADLFEVSDPWLRDYAARDAFARAEQMSRKDVPRRRYVYVPGSLPREMVAEVWRNVHPRETVLTDEDKGMLPPVPIDRVRRHNSDSCTVLHMYTNKPVLASATA